MMLAMFMLGTDTGGGMVRMMIVRRLGHDCRRPSMHVAEAQPRRGQRSLHRERKEKQKKNATAQHRF
jgi:hypothetical protein